MQPALLIAQNTSLRLKKQPGAPNLLFLFFLPHFLLLVLLFVFSSFLRNLLRLVSTICLSKSIPNSEVREICGGSQPIKSIPAAKQRTSPAGRLLANRCAHAPLVDAPCWTRNKGFYNNIKTNISI